MTPTQKQFPIIDAAAAPANPRTAPRFSRLAPLHAVAFGLLLVQPRLAEASAIADGLFSGDSDTRRTQSVLTGPAHVENAGGFTYGLFSYPGTFQFSASANGDSGTIRAYASESLTAPEGLSVLAIASMSESLTFQGASPGVVSLSLSVIGYFQNTGGPSGMSAIASLSLGGTVSQLSAEWRDQFGTPVSYGASGNVTGLGNPNTPDQIMGTLNVQALFNPGDTVPVDASLQLVTSAAGSSFAIAGFDNTAQLSMTLPAGWTYTSQSGTFLSQVPEPGSFALGGVGLAALVLTRRRARALARRAGRFFA